MIQTKQQDNLTHRRYRRNSHHTTDEGSLGWSWAPGLILCSEDLLTANKGKPSNSCLDPARSRVYTCTAKRI